jgi:hypothetical protein
MSRNYTDRTLIVDATEYDPIVVIGEIAHGAASSDRGPRAKSQMSNKERNHYNNLILLCQNCHARFDGQPNTYSEERWREIKAAHEAWVRASLPERGKSRTGWTTLGLQGDHPIDLATADEALSPDFIAGTPQRLQVPTDASDWKAVDATIAGRAKELLADGDAFDQRLAVFPLAPVSACLALGYHLTNRPHVRLFQYHSDELTWAWPRRSAPAPDVAVSGLDREDRSCRTVALLFHLSAVVTDAAIAGLGLSLERRVDFRVPQPSTAWLQHPEQVKWVGFEARWAFERAVQLFPQAEAWHVFYAGPAPVAVVVGQQVNPTMCPRVQLYEYRHKETPQYRARILLAR